MAGGSEAALWAAGKGFKYLTDPRGGGVTSGRYRDSRYNADYGAGLSQRQLLDPALLAAMQQQAATGRSPALQMMMRGNILQQAQARGMAASQQGVPAALAMRQGQLNAQQIASSGVASIEALRAQEMAAGQKALQEALLRQQGVNDRAAQDYETLMQESEKTEASSSGGNFISNTASGVKNTAKSAYNKVKSLF